MILQYDEFAPTICTMSNSYLKIGPNELERRIKSANIAYWNGDPTGYSDLEYEAMSTRLRMLRPSSDALIEVGHAPRAGSPTVDHARPMLSLRKAADLETLVKWGQGTSDSGYYATPKVDGVAVRLVYGPDGELQFAATRGNGKKGEIITKAVRAAGLELGAPGNSELRGELYITRTDFARYRDQGFACARNLVAGFVKQNAPEDNFPLRFYLYDAERDGRVLNEIQKMHLCDTLELEHFAVRVLSFSDFGELINHAETELRPSWPFETDGLVVRVESKREFESLGKTGHHPKGAIAYKFDDETAITAVRNLTWDVSRTGVITPVANFDPVNLAGASIESATLHHLGRLFSLGIREDSTIRVSRRGAVIPHVEGVVDIGSGKEFGFPKDGCPSCGGPVWSTQGESSGVVILTCNNPNECPGVMQGRAIYFASTVGIKGLGPNMAYELMLQGRLENLPDLYALRPRDGDPKTVSNLCREIEHACVLEPAVFLEALGVSHLGKETAEAICRKYPISKILVALEMWHIESISGIGTKVAVAVTNELLERRLEFLALSRCVHLKKAKVVVKGGKWPNTVFAGASVLFTGTLQAMTRDAAEKKVQDLGGHISRSASKTLDILVSTTPESSKTQKVNEWIDKGSSISIMSEEEFIEALNP